MHQIFTQKLSIQFSYSDFFLDEARDLTAGGVRRSAFAPFAPFFLPRDGVGVPVVERPPCSALLSASASVSASSLPPPPASTSPLICDVCLCCCWWLRWLCLLLLMGVEVSQSGEKGPPLTLSVISFPSLPSASCLNEPCKYQCQCWCLQREVFVHTIKTNDDDDCIPVNDSSPLDCWDGCHPGHQKEKEKDRSAP